MKHIKLLSALLAALMVINAGLNAAFASGSAFELIRTDKSDTLGGTIYYYRHKLTGAEVVYNDNNSDSLQFALGFKTPPIDSKGANHVLEHALFCGSEKYPTKNLMHYIQNGTSSLILNGITADDCTYYLIMTGNETEYFNMIDVYMNGIFHPLFLSDENIFRQQGIRIEYADGKAQYNGVVYNELRIKNFNTDENSVNFLADKLYRSIYGDAAPSFSAGGELDAIKELTYEDLLRVYNTYYIPSNSMTYLAGNLDLDRAFSVLDAFFSENTSAAPDISFEDTKQIPSEPVSEYNVDENTETVDIGFMSSGVPASADAAENCARDIIYNIIYEKMKAETNCTDMFTSGGNSGGVANLALILSQIPIEQKNEAIAAYNKVLDELSENSIDENDIDKYIEDQQRYFYANWENIFNGLLYHSDPIAYTKINSVCDYLKNHKEYFTEILKKYFTENPYSVVVVSGNGSFGSEDSSVTVSTEELERIKLETEKFQKWNDAEDAPEIIDRIPFLTLDEVKDAPEKSEPVFENNSGIPFYSTEKDSGSVGLYFPLDISDDDFDYVQLMHYFLEGQANKAGLSFYTALSPLENAEKKINPHFIVGLYGENAADDIKAVIEFLQHDDTWNADDLAEYIKSAPQKILDSYYDPYFVSSEMKNSALSASGRFGSLFPQNTIVKGSPHYYHFLLSLDPAEAQKIAGRIKSLANDLIVDSKPTVEFLGQSGDYESFKNTVTEHFAAAAQRESAELQLPRGYYSAATITKLADANHFMLAAAYNSEEYSGKLDVLAKVLSAKYVTPIMRGKHGAYGASISFYDNTMTAAVAGLSDIDLAIEIWQGMGDYLRNINLTQKELDAFIVSALENYDKWYYDDSEYGARFAITGRSSDEGDRVRNEMLSTTVEDVKGYADFIDGLVGQMRVFAVLGKSAADNAKFNFAYYADAETLTVTPRFKKGVSAYIDVTAPDEYITRAEAAEIISGLITDEQKPEYIDLSSSEQFITRAELASVLAKFIFKADTALKTEFSDLSEDDWFCEPMSAMVNAGYIKGYGDGTLRPDSFITRAEAAIVISRMLEE